MICTVNATDANSEDIQTMLCLEMNADVCGQTIHKNASITSGEVEEEAGRNLFCASSKRKDIR